MNKLLPLTLLMMVSTPAVADDRDVFEAKIISVGPEPAFMCGVIAATQRVTARVTKAHRGHAKVGNDVTIEVVVCGPGKHFVAGKVGVKLDPKQFKPGAAFRFDTLHTNDGRRMIWEDKEIQP